MERIKQKFGELKEHSRRMKKEVQRQMVSYILAGLGVVAGFAWNDAIKEFIEYLFPIGKDTLFAKFTYAAVITLLVVFVSAYVVRFFGEEEK